MKITHIIRSILLTCSVFLLGFFFFSLSSQNAYAANYTMTVSNYHLDKTTGAISFQASNPNPLFDTLDRIDVVVTSAPYDIVDSAVLYRSNWPNNTACTFGTPQVYDNTGYYCNNNVLLPVNPNQNGGVYICMYSEFDNNIYCSQEIDTLDLFANVTQATMTVSNYHLDTATNQISFQASNPNPLFDDTDRIDIFLSNSPLTTDPHAIDPTDAFYATYWPNNPACTYGTPQGYDNTGFYCNNNMLTPTNTTPASTVYLCLYSVFNTRMYCSEPILYTDLTQTVTPTPTSTPTPTPSSVQLTAVSPAKVWVGLKNSDDVGVKFDLLAEIYKDGNFVTSGEADSLAAGSSGFNNAKLDTIIFNTFSPIDFPSGSQLSVKLSVRNACVGSGHNSGVARLWYNGSDANSLFDATIGLNDANYYLLDNFLLGTNSGSIKKTIDVQSGTKCSVFKPFGIWTITP